MHFLSERLLDRAVLERDFAAADITGTLWTPLSMPGPVPLILLGHPGDMRAMYPRLAARAKAAAAQGFASVTIELPGAGDRPRLDDVDDARADLRRALQAGAAVTADIIDRLVLPLVDRAVPEWQATMDAALALPEIRGPVGYSGGIIAVGVRLCFVDPRIAGAGLFAGSFVPGSTFEEARRVSIPIHVLLQWDDRGNDRQMALDLFDAFGSAEKTLEANLGGHTGVPAHAGDGAAAFFARHLS